MAEGTDHALERLVFFSDAVIAISITLLVIEIHPPHLDAGAGDGAHWQALARLIPNFVGYAVSFWVIGMFWMGHHRAFALARRYDGRILPWNLMLLMTVAFVPFVTGYFSANFGERVPTLVYCLAMLAASLLNLKVNAVATSAPMVGAEVAAEEAAGVRRRSLSVALGAATAVALAAVAPPAAPAGLAAIPLWRMALAALERRRPAAAAEPAA